VLEIVSVNFSHAVFFWISWPLKMGLMGCPKTSVRKFHSLLCNIPEERRPHMMIWRAGLGLTPHGLVQSSLVWHGLVWHFIGEFKIASHI